MKSLAAKLLFSLALSGSLCIGLIAAFNFLPVFEKFDSRIEGVCQLDPELGYFHKPGARSQWTNASGLTEDASINSLGFRGPEISQEKSLPRVILLGGSAIFGHGVRDEETISSRLSARLQESESPMEVINGAVRGYGLDQEFQLLRRRLIALKPDRVIWFVSPIDFEPANAMQPSLFDYDPATDRVVERDITTSLFYRSSSFILWARRDWNAGLMRLVYSLLKDLSSDLEAPRRAAEQRLKFKVFAREALSLASRENFKLTFVLLPNRYERSIADLEKMTEARVVDLLPDPELRSKWGELFQDDGAHFTANGSRVLAERLLKELR